MPQPCALWDNLSRILKSKVGETPFEAWISPVRAHLDEAKHTLVLELPNDFIKEWLVQHYGLLIRDILRQLNGGLSLEYRTNPAISREPKGEDPRRQPQKETPAKEKKDVSFLNPKFTFENFVVGPSNRFAHAACLATAESPAKAYNPLFIYGRTGLGKTHLMQAVCHRICQHNPQTRFYYTSSEKFTNDLISAIQHRSTQAFRDKFRNVDVLLIDDIHFIANKEATQEEFFHTFNALYEHHKQIIISSDRPPREIQKLEERLVSRFNWGLVTDIQPPDYETRVAILKKKTEGEAAPIPENVICFIAETIKTNIRELEGALIRVIAYSLLQEEPVTLDMTCNVLKDLLRETTKHVSVEDIQRAVAEHYKVSLADLKTQKRGKNIVLPRQVAMFLARELTALSLPEIGAGFGGKDHTTVLYACKKIKRVVDEDAQLKNTIERLSAEIQW